MSGIYIHIPFCKQACSYCDFYFVTRSGNKDALADKLVEEIHSKKDTAYSSNVIDTIYFGGGTPSLLSAEQFDKIFRALDRSFNLDLKEVTVELNPDDVTKEYLSALKSIGVNRVSMGVQTFDEDLLKFMNRTHNSAEALKCLELLKASEINVFTADLIYGNPGQTLKMLGRDLDILLQFDPPHVSAYSLTIEPKTRLGKQMELGRLIPAEDETVEKHFELVEEKLKQKSIHRYEVSNFAKKGAEAVHNANYWEHKNYLGLGPGAHSFQWDQSETFAHRWENEPDLKKYLQKTHFNESEKEQLSLQSLAEERIMLGLRTVKGVSIKKLEKKYAYSLSERQLAYIARKVKEGRIHFDSDSIRLSSSGLKIADALTLDLITA
ncbi:MAG: radical SAM family heme chaperone HemW [Balneola sp.]